MNDGIYYDADHGVHQDGDGGVYLWEGRAMSDRVKPAYEIVTAAELRVGDVFKRDRSLCRQKVAKIERSSTGCLAISCEDHGFLLTEDHHEVLRQLPPERNPEVLERALEIASSQVLETTHAMMERKSPFPSKDDVRHYAKSCIDKAIRELESEAGMYGHSELAALLGICECRDCQSDDMQKDNDSESGRLERTDDDFYDGVVNTKDWHMWGIRSPNYKELFRHRAEMLMMGCIVGPIHASRGWKEDLLPMGMFSFKARILRSEISKNDLDSLAEWDRKFSGDPEAMLESEAGDGVQD